MICLNLSHRQRQSQQQQHPLLRPLLPCPLLPGHPEVSSIGKVRELFGNENNIMELFNELSWQELFLIQIVYMTMWINQTSIIDMSVKGGPFRSDSSMISSRVSLNLMRPATISIEIEKKGHAKTIQMKNIFRMTWSNLIRVFFISKWLPGSNSPTVVIKPIDITLIQLCACNESRWNWLIDLIPGIKINHWNICPPGLSPWW